MSEDPATLAERLTTWFERHGRTLPWRAHRTPYRVWVSEIMLQQTRVDTVLRYYEPFLERFPDVHALAAATEAEVLKAWQGLGYYQRARRLHQASRTLVEQQQGNLPDTAEALRDLSGIGPYTATAIAAFAFGAPDVAIDANVRRVGARWLGQMVPDDGKIARAFGAVARHAREPAVVAEALIEVGALVCTPRDPGCGVCPLRQECAARATGDPGAMPRSVPRRPPRETHRTASLMLDERGVWLVERPPEGLLGGLWGVPQADTEIDGTNVGHVRHEYTHLRLTLDVVVTDAAVGRTAFPAAEHVPWERLADLPVSVVDLKVFALAREAGALPPKGEAAMSGTMAS